MHFRSRRVLFVIIVFFLLVAGCKKERPSPSWNVDLLTPLFTDTVTITDVLSDTLISINPDHSVSFVFDEKLYDLVVDSLVKLPDTLFNWLFSLSALPNPITLQPGDTIFEEVFEWPLDFDSFYLDGVELENVLIRSGNIKFEVLNQSETSLLSVFGIISAVRNESDTFRISEKIPAYAFADKTYDVSAYNLDLTGEDGLEYNVLQYYLAMIVHPDEPGSIQINPEDTFAINIHFSDIVIDYAKGYFGQNNFNFGPENFEVDFFSDLNAGAFSVENASINLRIENNYGVEGYYRISELKAKNSETGDEVPLQGIMIDSNLFIDRAMQEGNGLNIIYPNIQSYDFSNSNFPDMISILPDLFTYKIEVDMNVLGDSTNHDNFFYYDSPISVFMDAEVNQGVMIQDMFVENTMEWNGSGVSFDNVGEGQIVILFKNGFPFSFDVNMYLEDENHEVLDTLVYNGFVEGGLLDENNRVIEPTDSRITVGLDDRLRQSIVDARFNNYELLINSAESKHVRIYSDDILQMKVIGDFTLLVEQD
ncbi:MAG: hypothetical protein JW731_07235 [Bacteroidales bacterium]|nr:hypothetical protein [Bacteroidales bacterium]